MSQNMSLCWNDDTWSFVRVQVLTNASANLQHCLWDIQIGFNTPPTGEPTILAAFLPFGGRVRNNSLSVASSSGLHQLMTSLSLEVFVLSDAGSANSHTFTFAPSPNPTLIVTADPATLMVTTTTTVEKATPFSIWTVLDPSVLSTTLQCMSSKSAALWTTCV